MDITLKNLKEKSKLKLLSYNDVAEEYTKIILKLDEYASRGRTDYNYFMLDAPEELIYRQVINILKLDGFQITHYLIDIEDPFVNISWGGG